MCLFKPVAIFGIKRGGGAHFEKLFANFTQLLFLFSHERRHLGDVAAFVILHSVIQTLRIIGIIFCLCGED